MLEIRVFEIYSPETGKDKKESSVTICPLTFWLVLIL
jgi:hypothetical protein